MPNRSAERKNPIEYLGFLKPGRRMTDPERPTPIQRLRGKLFPNGPIPQLQRAASEAKEQQQKQSRLEANKRIAKQAVRDFASGRLPEAIQAVDKLPEAKSEIEGNWTAQQLTDFLTTGVSVTKRLRKYNTDLAFASARQEGDVVSTKYVHGNGEATRITMISEEFWKGYEMYLETASKDRIVGTSTPAAYRIDIEELLKKQAVPQDEESNSAHYVLPELITKTVRPQDRLEYALYYVDGHRPTRTITPTDFVKQVETFTPTRTATLKTAKFQENRGARVEFNLTDITDIAVEGSETAFPTGTIRPEENRLYLLALAAKQNDDGSVTLIYPNKNQEADGKVNSWQISMTAKMYIDLMQELRKRYPKYESVIMNFQNKLVDAKEYAVHLLPRPTSLDSVFIPDDPNRPDDISPLATKVLE